MRGDGAGVWSWKKQRETSTTRFGLVAVFSFLFFFFIILVAIFVTVSRRCDSVSWFGLDVREVERWMEGDFTLVVRFHLVFSLSLSLFSFGA